ncbi:MAG: PDZ domain-containing protein [Bacteroidota bacterium]
MKIKSLIGFFLCWILGLGYLTAQRFSLPEQTKSERISFEFLNNLILIPVEVNGTELTFVLDSGVGKPILFNMMGKDSIEVRNVSEVEIKGLGDGEAITALKSFGNGFRIGKVRNFNQELFVVMDEALNFSPALGVPVHGIIGYDLFRDFVVEINYSNKYIKLHDPKFYKPTRKKKDVSLALDIRSTKAFLKAEVLMEEGNVPVKLLVDTGSSDALWLFNQPEKGLQVPDKNYEDFLGRGLSGDVFGKRTKINGVKIAKFEMFDPKVAFPHPESLSFLKNYGNRNGSIGGELLKRFNVVFDYGNRTMILRKNRNFNTPFEYNLSGINLQHNGIRYISERIANTISVPIGNQERGNTTIGSAQMVSPTRTKISVVPEIVISAIRAGSPAEEVGLRKGDVILEVNGKQVHQYKLQEIIQMINAKKGKRVKLLIERYNRDLLFSFVLKELF